MLSLFLNLDCFVGVCVSQEDLLSLWSVSVCLFVFIFGSNKSMKLTGAFLPPQAGPGSCSKGTSPSRGLARCC